MNILIHYRCDYLHDRNCDRQQKTNCMFIIREKYWYNFCTFCKNFEASINNVCSMFSLYVLIISKEASNKATNQKSSISQLKRPQCCILRFDFVCQTQHGISRILKYFVSIHLVGLQMGSVMWFLVLPLAITMTSSFMNVIEK